jgi:hypothetical protein
VANAPQTRSQRAWKPSCCIFLRRADSQARVSTTRRSVRNDVHGRGRQGCSGTGLRRGLPVQIDFMPRLPFAGGQICAIWGFLV